MDLKDLVGRIKYNNLYENSFKICYLYAESPNFVFHIRATCIEMVTSLAYTYHGRQYLAQEGIIDQISNIIVGADSDPFSSFYLPGKKH
jgi:hypothetical protein